MRFFGELQQPENEEWLIQRIDWNGGHPAIDWPVWVQHANHVICAVWDGANWINAKDQSVLVGVTRWREIG